MLPAPLALLFTEGIAGVIGLMVMAALFWVLIRVAQVAAFAGVLVLVIWFLSTNVPPPGA